MYQGGNEESLGMNLCWVVPLAGPKNALDCSLQGYKSSENTRKLHKSRPSLPERLVRECEGARRWIARDRSGFKRYARQDLYAWLIQFMGRWAASL